MKRLLVSTTALVSIVAGSAFADASKLDVKLNGLVNFEYGVRTQKSAYKASNLSTNQKNSQFLNSARVSVSATAQADAGYTYGAVAGLNTSASQRNGKDSSTTDNTYIFVDSSMGRVEVGSNYSASKTMGLSGGSVARGTGGANGGDWDNFVKWDYSENGVTQNFDESTDNSDNYTKTNPSFSTSSGLLSDGFSASSYNSENTNKVTYYTPKVAGFQLGVSYAPDSDVNGSQNPTSLNRAGIRTLKNLVNAGLTYNNTFDQFTLGVSAIGSTGTYKKLANETNHNYQGYAFGTKLSYGAFSLAGNYGTANKKFFVYEGENIVGNVLGSASVTKAPTNWSAGVAYVQGPFGVSVNYFDSKSPNKNKFTAWSLGADYSLAQGITSYAEFTQFNAKPNKTQYPNVRNNKGNVFLVGTALSF